MNIRHSATFPRRAAAAAAVVLVIAAGLASRHHPGQWPGILRKYPGDALWSMMVFFGFRLMRPLAPTRHTAAAALATSFAVEFSQLYQAPWILAIRATTAGHLVLGSGYHTADLAAYTAGTLLACACDRLLPAARDKSAALPHD